MANVDWRRAGIDEERVQLPVRVGDIDAAPVNSAISGGLTDAPQSEGQRMGDALPATASATPAAYPTSMLPILYGGRTPPLASGVVRPGDTFAVLPMPVPPLLAKTTEWEFLIQACNAAVAELIKAAGVAYTEAMANISAAQRGTGNRQSEMDNAEQEYKKALEDAKEEGRKNRIRDLAALEAMGGTVSGNPPTPYEAAMKACDDRHSERLRTIQSAVQNNNARRPDEKKPRMSESEALEQTKRALQEHKMNHKLVEAVFGDSKPHSAR